MPIMYCLAEIIDEDKLRTFQFNSDSFYITKYFMDIGAELEDICEFYIRINDVFELYNKRKSPYVTQKDLDLFEENNQRILALMNGFYEKKYGKNMYTSINIRAYLYNSIYVNDDFNNKFEQDINMKEIEDIIPKGYVSETYKSLYPCVTAISKGKEVQITEEKYEKHER